MAKNNKPKNDLTLMELATEANDRGAVSEDELKKINKFILQKFPDGAPEYAVCYLNYGIRFACWKDNVPDFYEDGFDWAHLQLARIFNKDQELKIWKSEAGFNYRVRIDSEGEKGWAIEAEQILWGTRSQKLDESWTRLFEDRGTELIIPLKIEIPEGQEVPNPRACIRTRNYIDYLDNGQASFVDCRFVEFKLKNKE